MRAILPDPRLSSNEIVRSELGGHDERHRYHRGGQPSKTLILAAMIFAVAMTFIDQTIVSIAAPEDPERARPTRTGVQWVINAYLLSLAALFAFGGRLADTVGHRRMVRPRGDRVRRRLGDVRAHPEGSFAEAWIVTFRVVQGAGGAIMFPAALAIVVADVPPARTREGPGDLLRDRRRSHRVGPIARRLSHRSGPGGRSSGSTSPSPSRPDPDRHLQARDRAPAGPLDYRGLALIIGGVGLSVFGFQQSITLGLGRPRHRPASSSGALLVVFVFVERRTASPLIALSIFRIRPFLVENPVLVMP